MYQCDGIDDGAILHAIVAGEFSCAIWFRTEQVEENRCLFGVAAAAGAQEISVHMNGGGDLRVLLHKAGGDWLYQWDGPYNDGGWHCLIITRSGSRVAVLIDGGPPGVALDEADALTASDFTINRAFGVGARNLNGNLGRFIAQEVGQWGVWDYELSEAQRLTIAAGGSFAATTPTPVEHWKCRDRMIDPPGAEAPFFRGTIIDEQMRGYAVLSRASVMPVVGITPPIRYLTHEAVAMELAESELAMLANRLHYVGLVPFNVSGAGEMVVDSFPTDANARPVQAPTPVHEVRVSALSGGRVSIAWKYDEQFAVLAVADQFRVRFEALFPTAAVDDLIVPHAEGQREYQVVSAALADGPWRIRVESERDGRARRPVTGFDVMADATAPVGDAVGLVAV